MSRKVRTAKRKDEREELKKDRKAAAAMEAKMRKIQQSQPKQGTDRTQLIRNQFAIVPMTAVWERIDELRINIVPLDMIPELYKPMIDKDSMLVMLQYDAFNPLDAEGDIYEWHLEDEPPQVDGEYRAKLLQFVRVPRVPRKVTKGSKIAEVVVEKSEG